VDDHDPDDEEDTDRRRPTAAELRRHRRTVPGGVPAVAPSDPPDAEPDFEWPVTPDRRDAEVLRRAARDPEDPVRPAEISAIVHKLAARLREEVSRLLTDQPQDLNKRVGALERDFEPVRRLGKWAAGVALGAALAIGAFLYRRGADEQRIADEIKAARDKAERCELKIDSFLNIKDPRP
jgi:outer membrane murein-binding lipoprotein Lpp